MKSGKEVSDLVTVALRAVGFLECLSDDLRRIAPDVAASCSNFATALDRAVFDLANRVHDTSSNE